jgi:hypothetical protein
MFARTLCFAIVGISLCSVGLQAGGGGKDAKDTKDKKFEIPKDAIVGIIKMVDMKAPSFTIAVKDAKDRTFGVTKETEFWGPKGGDRGTGPKGLEDDCMAKGYEIKVAPTKDGKNAKDVFLSVRKSEKKAVDKK